jgi:aminoglycoside phosphotransferase (APT) family kinase protein
LTISVSSIALLPISHRCVAAPDRNGRNPFRDTVAGRGGWTSVIVKMHDDEIDIDVDLVRRLLRAQFPQWSELRIEPVDSTGTVNAVFRLGDRLAVRLPRTPRWHDLETEMCWLDGLAARLPVTIPEAVARGEPSLGYPWPWAVFTWIDGRTWDPNDSGNSDVAADDVAGFLEAVQALDPGGQPCGTPDALPTLARSDGSVRSAIDAATGMVDTDAVRGAWARALRVPEWQGPRVLLHGDVLAGNVLVRGYRLHAVIDWAGVRRGDPARDLMAAWTLFRGESRRRFRAVVDADDDTWSRARGWALTRITNVAYYASTNPTFAADAVATITEALADEE